MLLTCLPTCLHLLPGHLCWCFTHLFIGISLPVCMKEKGEYDCPVSVTVLIAVSDVLLPQCCLPVLSQTSLRSALSSVSCHLILCCLSPNTSSMSHTSDPAPSFLVPWHFLPLGVSWAVFSWTGHWSGSQTAWVFLLPLPCCVTSDKW